MQRLKKRVIDLPQEEIWMVTVSVLFGIIFCFCKIAGDDSPEAPGLLNCFHRAADYYFNWSSRFLINFIIVYVISLRSRLVLMIYMSFSMYIMLKAMVLLFGDGNRREIAICTIVTIMMFPFEIQTSAGWISTSLSYFIPHAYAMMALVPIKKVLKNQIISKWEYIFYCLCLVYSVNAEQICVAMLLIYLVAIVYLCIEKKNNWRIWFLFLLNVLSILYTFTCPGNWKRKISEESSRFPTYGMLNLIDKAEIGVSTTLKWIYARGNLFIIIMCIMCVYIIWKKYSEPFYRFIALIPASITIILGPLKNVLSNGLGYLTQYASSDVAYYGTFTPDALDIGGGGKVQFLIFLLVSVCICIEIILINDKIIGFIIDITLILLGVASRCMMGFSPTIYASSERTYTTLVIFFMAVIIHIYSLNQDLFRSLKTEMGHYAMGILILLEFVNFTFLVAVW